MILCVLREFLKPVLGSDFATFAVRISRYSLTPCSLRMLRAMIAETRGISESERVYTNTRIRGEIKKYTSLHHGVVTIRQKLCQYDARCCAIPNEIMPGENFS